MPSVSRVSRVSRVSPVSHLLGIDIGTSGTKTLICDDDGNVLATAMAEHPISSPKPGWSEQNPEDWWQATVHRHQGRAAERRSSSRPTSAAIGLSGPDARQRLSRRRPQGPAARAALERPAHRRAVCRDRIQGRRARGADRAGRQPRPHRLHRAQDPLGPPARAEGLRQDEAHPAAQGLHPLSHDRRIRHRSQRRQRHAAAGRRQPHLVRQAARAAGDRQGAAARGCTNRRRSPARCTQQAPRRWACKPGTPVVGGAGDQAAGAVGNGIVSPGIVSATLGTSGVVFAHSDAPTRDPQGRVHTMCHAVPGKWCVFGCMLSAGGSFQWLRNQLGRSRSRRRQKAEGRPVRTADRRGARPRRPAARGCSSSPTSPASAAPTPTPPPAADGSASPPAPPAPCSSARSSKASPSACATPWKSCDRWASPSPQVRASGGGARSDFWRQLQADIYNAPIVLTNAAEGPAYGVALLAGVGTGVWGSVEEACKRGIRQTAKVTPAKKRRRCTTRRMRYTTSFTST